MKTCYFQSLLLSAIRSFGKERQTLDFVTADGKLAQWNLILGDNGLGKTTILQCLVDATADLNGKPLNPTASGKKSPPYIPRGLRKLIGGKSNRSTYPSIGANRAEYSVKFAVGVTLNSSIQPVSVGDQKSSSSFTFRDGHFQSCSALHAPLTELQPYGYGIFRRFGASSLGAELNPDACATLFDEDKPLLNVEEWLLRADYAASKSKDAASTKRLKLIRNLLTSFLPDVSDVRIPSSGPEVPIPEVKTSGGWVPVRQLSTGYRATMAWVTDFAARMIERYPESVSPFAEPAVVLVDQIDLHLHPKWQRQLIADLAATFPATQFIVTAHSPLVVQAMPGANICLLQREGDVVKISRSPENVRGWRLDQIIASDLFDSQPTRDSETEKRLFERRELILKHQRSPEQQAHLRNLNEWAESIPTAESADDIRAMEIIRRAASKLEKQRS